MVSLYFRRSLLEGSRRHGFEISPLGKDPLEALRTLAFSENPGLQQSAALYYLHMSQHMNVPLPVEHLEPFYALLRSADLEVQQMSSLSLVNFLLEGNIDKELVVQMGLLEPILDLLESEDPTVQCNSCACTMTLAVSESNREAIGAAQGVTPLLSLASSYDPRVQQNAVGAIFNLTQSEKIQQVLCKEGALPVLALLLESPDSEVQYYSCAALSNVAANVQHHEAMLRPSNRFLLQTLISLLSSSVDKVSSQACICLRNLATSADIQAEMVAEDVLPKLCSLLTSGSEGVRRASIALLWILSQHPHNQDTLACAELLQSLGMLLAAHKTDPVIVGHTACIIKNLSLSKNIQRIIESPCVEGLLQTMLSADVQEDSLCYVTSCLAELAKQEGATLHMVQWMDEPLTKCLVRLAGQLEHTESSFQAASIIQHMIGHEKMMLLSKRHIGEIQAYLKNFLTHQEIRFQQLGISTFCRLRQDPEFSFVFRKSQMAKLLKQVRQQMEETQELLRAAICHEDS
ncbi:vacuolar protein 8 isoform X4 [Egretta garzetta]|uniref:vacuolar protein 8 isoform X4 n=1 Tax=Egretta garzetta TaxID=188379 RepID=UPI00163B9653|nr:vacuolar protein 8 isoform X4 [Egretta garzetta]XP_035755728.1 vacuolar protein 8 isoform X4 [Egretta garzetta]XP_035755729.1 vacuolar protein 8 isoform X4 [Egretta garzetta]XP_035755730.1 vacuolar protein 8 isoform X4 [Egretta garzetta]